MLELLRIRAPVGDAFLAEAPLLVDLAVRRECFVGVGADLAARVRLVAAVLDALALANARHLVRVASSSGTTTNLKIQISFNESVQQRKIRIF